MSDIHPLRDIPILIGAFFVLTAAVGVVRFPDLYTRLHASSKLVTLGSAGIFLGVALELNDDAAFTRLAAVLLFQFLTAPLTAYLIAQAAYLRGLPPLLGDGGRRGIDEWGVLGQAEQVAQADRDAQRAMMAEGE